MEKSKADLFKHILFTREAVESKEIVSMFATLIAGDDKVLKVYELIFKNSFHPRFNPKAKGVTKKEICESIKVYSKVLSKADNRFKKRETYITRDMVDDVINFLSGTSLIYFEEGVHREKPYQLTPERGLVVAKKLVDDGLMENHMINKKEDEV